MPRLKLFGIAVIAVIALSGLASSVASAALPEFLPGTKNTFKVSGGTGLFEQKGGIAAVKCKKSEGTGAVEGLKTGSFDELYLECEAPLAGKCTGLDDTVAGSILAKGTFEVGYINKATLDVGILFTIKPVHFECEKLITLVTVEGCAIGLITPINSSTTAYTVKLKQTKGVNEFTKDEGAECKLLSEINGGAKTQSGQETEPKITLSAAAELMA